MHLAEKRARLKTNPVKVRFAEEVVVNGHTQGSSLLCMPNVLKVYLENGQTKAFKFDASTTVKDIILTLKEKLSIRSIEHFALVLEEQYNVLKMYLLHDDELITQVVQKKESHNYRCLFRVCFIPRDPLDLLQQDPVAFEYLYLQSCSDVLQERFAVEMKCSVALRLAALHIQERTITCAQPQKVSLKYIEKDWGIENFISPTLLRNMRGKDIKKAISFHMKRNQLLLDPRQKHLLSAAQVRLCYLQILGDLKLFGGKIFNVTLMLQDRESCIALLVGAKYGISQVVNNKLNIVTMLAEFANISRVELLKESDKVSMVKIYLQDIKLLTLMLESNSAKDLACLLAGYYKLLVDPTRSIFVWGDGRPQTHRYSTEEGYESRTCSDSEESSELDSSLDRFPEMHSPKHSCISPLQEEEGEQEEPGQERPGLQDQEVTFCNGYDNTNDSLSEASDSANTESRGFKTSGSTDSLDALEEDDLEACSSSRAEFFSFGTPTLQDLTNSDKVFSGVDYENRSTPEDFFPFLPLPPLSTSALAQSAVEFRRESEINAAVLESKLAENDAMEYYNICANISPTSSGEKNTHEDGTEGGSLQDLSADPRADEGVGRPESRGFTLAPPSGFGDNSSEDEFYDTKERVTPTEARTGSGSPWLQNSQDVGISKAPSYCSLVENILSRHSTRVPHRAEKEPTRSNSLKKRRSFLQTNYTSQVSFPFDPLRAQENIEFNCCGGEVELSGASCSPAGLSIEDTERDLDPLNAEQLVQLDSYREATNSSTLMEMEPETLETKSVTDSVVSSISAVRLLGAQESEQISDFPTSSFSNKGEDESLIVSSSTLDQNIPSSELSFQLEEICPEKEEDPPETSCRFQERCVATTEHEPEEKLEWTSETPLDSGVSYLLIEEIIHTTTKPPWSVDSHQNKQLICEPALDPDIPSTDQVENHEQLVLDPCERVHDNSAWSEPSQASERLENTSNNFSKDSFQKSGDPKQASFPSVTELLSDGEGTSEIVTPLSWLSFNSMVDNTEPHQQNDDKYESIVGPRFPYVSQASFEEDPVLSDCWGPPVCHISAVTMSHDRSLFAELDNDQKSDGEPITNSATEYKNKQPSPLAVPTEDNVEQRKYDHSNGLGYLPFGILCEPAGPSGESGVSGPSFLPCSPTEGAAGPVICSHKDSPALNAKETVSPTPQADKCSCQFSYASCFHGLGNESAFEDTNPALQGASEEPLTTPPARSPLCLDFASVRSGRERNSADAEPKDYHSRVWLLDSHIEALGHVKDRLHASPLDFCHLLDHVMELQETLKLFWGNRAKHPREKCSAYFSASKNTLCMESQRLMSSCQKVIKICGLSTEIQGAIQETFRHLLQLTEACFHFTNCGLCSGRHKDLAANLKDVVCSYHQFVQAAQQAGEKGCPSLSIKLLVCQYTALTAALFCLVQQFKAPPSL
ncbi:FERM and PDZ domain-containing protein 1 isoform X2 [Paroedura picta]|uniref:FERM and PDZ domain-containing protein 1 isoform X2 n=1 Tax=Paroedura picta TaxID=143630 RepID=UPI004056D83A